MLDWKDFCRALAVDELIPDEFAEYRQPIVDAIVYFLESLSPARTETILADQATLPMTATVEVRIIAVARHCPILHKLGQMLARDRRLPADFRHLLQQLESITPAIETDDVRTIVQNELGDLAELGVSIEEAPLAEASVAVVTPFVWRDPKFTQPRRGVFKVLKANVEQHLQEELQILRDLGVVLDERCEHYGIPKLDYEGLFAQASESLGHEIDLRIEQRHLVAAKRDYAATAGVVVPELFPFCTARVTAMQRIDGDKVTELPHATGAQRRQVAAGIIEAMIARPLWSAGESTMFHADPHAGNLFLTRDGELAILDWSLAGRLGKQELICLSQILLGAMTLNARHICSEISSLADGSHDSNALKVVVDNALRDVRRAQFPGLRWLTGLLDDAVTQAQISLGHDLLMFRKVLHTLEGVIADVSEDCMADAVLAASFLRRLGREWPHRTTISPFSRDTTTHVSNADLMSLVWSGPSTSARYWHGVYRDLTTA